MASGTQKAFAAILLLSVALRAANAKEIIVGGDSGWTVPSNKNGLADWADKTNFVVGDTLVFNYNIEAHSVLSVPGSAFAACDTSQALEIWLESNTKIKLEKEGKMWFICGTPNHCSKGQAFKITVNAAQKGAGNALAKGSKALVILVTIIIGICLQVL